MKVDKGQEKTTKNEQNRSTLCDQVSAEKRHDIKRNP
jgi:hypothetical protein